MTKPKNHDFVRCICCGHVVARRALTQGALGFEPQALKRKMVGKGNGPPTPKAPKGTGIVWTRRSMRREELVHVSRAIARAAETAATLLDQDGLTVIAPEDVLSGIDDREELDDVTAAWLEDARKELEYRLKVIDEEYQRRGDHRGR